MSFPWGAVAVLGAGAAVFAFMSSPPAKKSSGVSTPKGDLEGRYDVHRQIVAESPAVKPKAGDSVLVQLSDKVRGIDVPAILKIARVVYEKDGIDWGLDAVYEGSAAEKAALEGLNPGTHFAVFPLDIVEYLPVGGKAIPGKTVPGGGGFPLPGGLPVLKPIGKGAGGFDLYSHVLTSEDVSAGPTAFATLAGFASVREMLIDNPALKSEIGYSGDTGYYFEQKPGDIFPSVYKVVPWEVGVAVKTRNPIVASSAADSGGFGGFAPNYGGRYGFGSVDFGIRNL